MPFGLAPLQWVAIVAGIGFAAWQFWPSLSAIPGKFKWPATPAMTDEDDDVADFKALRRLRARFERLKSKDGLEACATCLAHFDHQGRT